MEPNKTTRIKTSAPVICPFYRTATRLAVNPIITTHHIPALRCDQAASMAILREFQAQSLGSGTIGHGPDPHLVTLFRALAAG